MFDWNVFGVILSAIVVAILIIPNNPFVKFMNKIGFGKIERPEGCLCPEYNGWSHTVSYSCPVHGDWPEPLYTVEEIEKSNLSEREQACRSAGLYVNQLLAGNADEGYFSNKMVHVWIDDTGDSGWAGFKFLCIECYEKALENTIIEEANRCTPTYLSKFKDMEEPYCSDCGGQGH